MATASFVGTWNNGGQVTSTSNSNYQVIGYSGSNARYRNTNYYTITSPTLSNSKVTKVTFTINLKNTTAGGSSIPAGKVWKIAVTSSADSGFYDGYSSNEGDLTSTFSNSSSISWNGTATINVSFENSTYFGSAKTYHVYLYSGKNEFNNVKVTSVSYSFTTSTITYKTSTTLTLTSGGANDTDFTSPVPSSELNGAGYYNWIVKNLTTDTASYYKTFYLYKAGVIFEEGNGQTKAPTGTLIQSVNVITSGTSQNIVQTGTNSEGTPQWKFDNGSTSASAPPSTNFPLEKQTGVVAVVLGQASNDAYAHYWQIEGLTPRYIYPRGKDFFYNQYSVGAPTATPTTATISVSVSGAAPTYISYTLGVATSSVSSSGTNSISNSKGTLNARSGSITATGLSPGTSYTLYPYIDLGSGYSSISKYRYYGLKSKGVTTTGGSGTTVSYTGTISKTSQTLTSATFSLSNLSSTAGLDGSWYLSTTNSTSTSSLASMYEAEGYSNKITIPSGLTAGASNTRYAYVYNIYNKKYYKIGSASVTMDASDYSGTVSYSSPGTTTANFTHGTLKSTVNLNNSWYLTTKHSAKTVASSSFNANIGSGTRGSSITGSGLTAATTQTVYAYVYSSATNYYHLVGSTSVTTSAPNYVGKVAVTGITGTSATLCLFAVSPTANMDSGYYATTTNYGSTTTTTPGTRIAIKNSTVITGLVPGKQYTYYFYIKNTSNNTFYLVSTQTFETYSSLVTYQGEPHRVWYYNTTNSRWEAAILKQGGSNVTITNLLPELGFKNVNNTATDVTWNTTHKHFGEGSICFKPTSAATEFTWPVSYKSGLGHNSNPYQTQNHIYYLSMWAYQPTKVGSIDFYWPIAEPVFISGQTVSTSGAWTKISGRNIRNSWSSGNQSCRIDFNTPDGTNAMYYADIMLVDLTATFGSGKEPNLDWCDKNIPYIPVKGSVFISSEEPDWT